ncbi:MAG: HAMP domain-containing histidine kinase [Candidatus Dadabacteria bacterium]|nr:MAG: HAMP domain-containing histidine kinase [Candidatus Dadabacteria bacterium]
MKDTRLLWKLYPSYLIIVALSVFLSGMLVAGTFKEFHRSEVYNDLKAKASMIGLAVVGQNLLGSGRGRLNSYCTKVGDLIATRITLILPDGQVLCDSKKNPKLMDNHRDRPEVKAALSGHMGRSVRFSHTLQKDMMYVAVPLVVDGAIKGVVRVAMGLGAVDGALAEVRKNIFIGSLVVAILAGILCFVIIRRISRPLENLTDEVEMLRAGKRRQRLYLAENTPREFVVLANAINEMAAEIRDRIKTVEAAKGDLEAILSSMSEGVVAIDSQGSVVMLNDASKRLLDIRLQKAEGRSLEEVIAHPQVCGIVRRTLQRGESVEDEVARANGSSKILQISAVPIQNLKGGKASGALLVINDITKIRQAEQIRRDFVANVSHELRTPITAIKGFAETLADGALNDKKNASKFLSIISDHADRMERIIQDLLILSSLEYGSGSFEDFSRINAKQLVEESVKAYEPIARERGVCIAHDLPHDLNLAGDKRLLLLALGNIVENAIKYSGKGGHVAISACRKDGNVVISVRDNGCGIPKEDLGRIFERFYRVDKARSRQEGGTGLGLAIVKHIASIHGGRVEVESSLNEGSTFSLFIPTEPSPYGS